MKQNKINLLLAAILILLAAVSKVITYPFSINPIIGMALFSGAVIKDKRFAFVLPLVSMFLSDIMMEMIFGAGKGFYGWGQLFNYGALAMVTVIGFGLKKINLITVPVFSLISSVAFWVLSNLVFFFIDNNTHSFHTYTNDFAGFINCFTAALPFLKWHVDLIFSVILFGSYYLITNYAINNKQVAA